MMKPFSVRLLRGLCVAIAFLGQLHAQISLKAQPYIFSAKHLTFGKSIVSLGQDKQGFMWAGTLENAYRFDGQQFEPLPESTKKTADASFAPAIRSISTDVAGNLWIVGGGENGLRKIQLVRPGEKTPRSFEEIYGHKDPFQDDPIHSFLPTNNRPFRYLLTTKGRVVRHLGGGHFRTIGRWRSPQSNSVLVGGLETQRGTLWVSTRAQEIPGGGTLMEIDSLGRILRRYEVAFPIMPMTEDRSGTLHFYKWVGYFPFRELPRLTQHKLTDFLYLLPPTGALQSLPVSFDQSPFFDNQPNSQLALGVQYDVVRNLYWICGNRVCFAWHPIHGLVFDLLKTNVPTASMQSFRTAIIDRTGAVWIRTDDGVVLVTLEPNRFTRYLHQPDHKATTDRYSIRGMVQQGNRLWVNTEESYWVDLSTGRKEPVLLPSDPRYPIVRYLYPAIQDRQGTIWSTLHGVTQITPSTGQVVAWPLREASPNSTGMALWHDGRRHLWVGYDDGLSVFDVVTKQNQPFTRYNQFTELAQNRVSGFFPDATVGGRIWLAASSGLYLLDTLQGVVARYSTRDTMRNKEGTTAETRPALPFDHITFVHPDPDERGVYWLATRGGGLIRWNRTTGQYQRFTEKQGLSNNTLYCIYEDQHQRLWLPSDYGLMAFHLKTHQIQIFHTTDGIADKEFNLTAHYHAPDGRLFLGGLNGITAFYPDQIRAEKPRLAPLVVTQYHKLEPHTGELVDAISDYQQQQHVRLAADHKLVSLSFALLDYRYLGNTRLWYRIVGWQDQWVMQPQMELRLNGLPAGDYTLEVRAQTTNGDWISPILAIPLNIDRPIYLQTWFLFLGLLALIGLVMAVFRWRNWQLIQEKTRLETEVARRTARIEQDKAIIERQAADLEANATLKTRFFANVSHEFRTPLTLLIGPLRYLSKRITDTSAQQLLQAMERNTQQLLGMVNDLLSLTRLDGGQVRLTEQLTDLSQLVVQLADTFRPQAQYNGVELTVKGTDTSLMLALDSSKVETVLRNLLANALQYTSMGGRVEIQLTSNEQEATITIADSGSGIHPDDLPRIFERYFQSNQVDKPLRGGTGIGLALCREYATLWGGKLTVQSELGQGSTFWVTYPVRPLTEQAQTGPPTVNTSWQPLPVTHSTVIQSSVLLSNAENTSQTTILLVDDNADMLLYMQTLLTPYYSVQTARNGRQALDLLAKLSAEQLPNIIISDIMMPEVDGLALVSELKKNALLRLIPIMLVTARTDLNVRLEALQLGVADYLTKPFHEAELLARIQNLLSRVEEQVIWQQEEVAEPALPSSMTDAEWIAFMEKLIRRHIGDSRLNIQTLAEMVHVSERQLFRRTKALTGLSPNQLIQEVRLQVAYDLFESQPDAMIKHIALQVGYQKASYFSRIYRERFGIAPGQKQQTAERAFA